MTAEPDKSLILILPLLRFFLEILMEHAGSLPEVAKKKMFFFGSNPETKKKKHQTN